MTFLERNKISETVERGEPDEGSRSGAEAKRRGSEGERGAEEETREKAGEKERERSKR